MTDIVERIRNAASRLIDGKAAEDVGDKVVMLDNAAFEIERLRSELSEAETIIEGYGIVSVQQYQKEITRLRAASEWRDISTAPRDTKAFLVWVPENQCTFQVSRTDRGLCIFGGDHRDYLDRATHWMPLPAPPQRNEVKK